MRSNGQALKAGTQDDFLLLFSYFPDSNSNSCFETRSAPSLTAATPAALPSISEIPFLDSWVPD
jgi:hypothetical protein